MARLKIAALLALAGLLCASCSEFFLFNAFAALDTPPAPALADYKGAGGLDKLAADLSSPAVVALLTADPTLVQEVKDYLETIFLSGTMDTADEQAAAVLYSDLSLMTTSGDTLVNNVVTAIMTTPPTGNLKDIISSIIPAPVLADATGAAFTAMVEGLLDANAAYVALGNSIPALGVPAGVNIGDVAQKAAVAYLMFVVVSAAINESGSAPNTTAEAEAEMFKLVTDDPTCTITGVAVTDPFNPLPGFLKNIFDAAGAPYPA
jgi:hypothetical protein